MIKGMTGITDMLNLPSLEEALRGEGFDTATEPDEDIKPDPVMDDEQARAAMEKLQTLATQVSLVNGTDHTDDMEELHKEILGHARDLMAYGFNVDTPRARGIFEVASTMYGHAMSAVNAKREFQLKAMQMALNKSKLELEAKRIHHMIGGSVISQSNETDNTIVVEDRNKLIAELRAKNQPK